MNRARGIDHLVLCVDNLDAARHRYEQFGFTTTPLAQHPFGTANSLVQLHGSFLELLSVAEPTRIQPMAPGRFSFGAFNARYLEARQGMSMLVFQSDDTERDHAEFVAKGLDTYEPFHFSRTATLPDGREVTVAFSLVFVTDRRMPEIAFFVCRQHAPEFFWKPEYQRHENGAVALTEVYMVAEEPLALGPFFERLQSPEQVRRGQADLFVETSLGSIRVMTPARFASQFPGLEFADTPTTPFFAGYQLVVTDLGAVQALLEQRGIAFTRFADSLQLSPADAFEAVIEFRAG